MGNSAAGATAAQNWWIWRQKETERGEKHTVEKAGEQCMARQPGRETSTKATGVAKHSRARAMKWRCSRFRA